MLIDGQNGMFLVELCPIRLVPERFRRSVAQGSEHRLDMAEAVGSSPTRPNAHCPTKISLNRC